MLLLLLVTSRLYILMWFVRLSFSIRILLDQMQLLDIRLNYNDFQFADRTFIHKCGTAMGKIDMVHQSTGGQLLFLSESLPSLQIIRNRYLSHPLIAEILCHAFPIFQ
jgi:hypothetical protein